MHEYRSLSARSLQAPLFPAVWQPLTISSSFGYTQEEVIGTSQEKYFAPDSLNTVARMMKMRSSGVPLPSYEITIIEKSGRERITTIRGVLIQYEGGQASLNVLTDITEQIQTEKALREREGHLRTLIQTIPDLVWLKDEDGIFLSCNPVFERFSGGKEEEIIGKTDYDFVDRELADFFREHDRIAMEAGRPSSNEEWITYADDGCRVLLHTIKTPMYDTDGTLIGVLGIGHDITDLKQAEDELISAQEILKESHRKINLLTSLTRHDILNQVTGLQILLSLASGSSDIRKIQGYIEEAKNTGERIERIIGFTREYEGFGIISSGWQNISRIIASSPIEFSLGHISLDTLIPEDLEVYADPIIRKVFSTLIENAISHGRNITKIRFSCSIGPDDLTVSCEDHGGGIPDEEKTLIFEHGYGKNTGI